MKEVGAFVKHGSWDDDLKDIPGVYMNNGGAFFVTVDTQNIHTIIGMGALKKVTSQRVEIKRMRVLPEFQGKGIGRNLLYILEKKAIDLGYTEAILDITIKQTAALHLYAKFGYKEYKRRELGGFKTIFMIKQLSAYKGSPKDNH